MMGFGMGFGWIFGLLILGLVFWVIMDRTGMNRIRGNNERQDAINILRMRFANGEITREQYEQIKKDLQA